MLFISEVRKVSLGVVAYACDPEIRRLRQRLVNSRSRLGLSKFDASPDLHSKALSKGGVREERREKKVKVKDEGGIGGRRMGRNYKSKI